MRRGGRRGQAAVEYLTTYGWALLLVTAAIGALFFFDDLRPTRYIPDNCWFGSQLECQDFSVRNSGISNSQVRIIVQNNFERDIEILNITSHEVDYATKGCNVPAVVKAGETAEFACLLNRSLEVGEKYAIPLTVDYTNNEAPGSPEHQISGEVFSVVSDFSASGFTECSDLVDNDEDGCADYANGDADCTGPNDDSESGTSICEGDPFAELSCFFTPFCNPTFTNVMKIEGLTDTHSQLYSEPSFNWYLCCRSATDTLDASCVSPDETVLYLSNFTDAHARLNTEPSTPYPVCLSAGTGTVNCWDSSSGPSGDEACLVTISDDTNAHISDCISTTFGTNIICEIQ